MLDVTLPDLVGFTMMRRLRDQGNQTPIVFLTARGSSEDRGKGLSAGGDDYIVEPFDVAELVARVQLRMKRADSSAASRRLRCDDLEMDAELHHVFRGGEEIHLSPTEYKLILYVMTSVGRVLSGSQILERVRSYEIEVDPSVVDTYIGDLRKKVEGAGERLLHTVRGVGFTLRAGL